MSPHCPSHPNPRISPYKKHTAPNRSTSESPDLLLSLEELVIRCFLDGVSLALEHQLHLSLPQRSFFHLFETQILFWEAFSQKDPESNPPFPRITWDPQPRLRVWKHGWVFKNFKVNNSLKTSL